MVTQVTGDWSAFASANGAELRDEHIVGRSIWGFISGRKVQDLYRRIYDAVRRTKLGFTLPCRCDGVTAMRHIRVHVQPVGRTNSLHCTSRITREVARPPVRLLERMAGDERRGAAYCSWCNRVQTPIGWVLNRDAEDALGADAVEATPVLVPSVCERCSRLLDGSLHRLLGPLAADESGEPRSLCRGPAPLT